LIDEFKEALYEHYNFPLFNDYIKKDEDKMEELLKDLKLFHQFSSWKMLQTQRPKLNSEDIE
jgi:hypothetical protein